MTTVRSLALLLVLASIPATVAGGETRDPHMREIYSGAGLLYSMPEVTVVYPAGPAENRERNLISAERRAAFLLGRYDVKARVLADIDFGPENHDDNLLVLGWGNKLLETAGQVERSESGWSFQGIERSFDQDLLFAWVSPFDSTHQFTFWSRIDPELDRYLVLPFFGSDWVVFDRYFVEQYGRFDKTTIRWPPRRNPELMVDNRPKKPRPVPKGASDHFVLYDLAGGLTDAETASILEAREIAWSASTALLGDPPDPQKIKLFVYLDSEQKEEVCFVHDARHHVPELGELHLTKAIALDPGLHEDSHLVARQVFGPGYLTLMVEGVAVWAEQHQGQRELPAYAHVLLQRGQVPEVRELLDEEVMRVLVRNGLGFSYAGLFVSWLHDEVGPEAIPRSYGLYASDLDDLARAIRVPADEIDAKFRKYVESQAKLGEAEATFRAARGEAERLARLGDYERAVPAYERALEIRPEDLPTRYSLALLQMDSDDPAGAEESFLTILRAPADERDEALTAFTWFQLGELRARSGEMAKAREAYESVLELPDHRKIHSRARQALASLH